MPYWSTCRRAVSAGINILVVHEPTFYSHWDLDESEKDFHGAPEIAKERYLELCQEKRRWLLKNSLVIIRCHDVLDRVPHFGIPFGFGQALGLREGAIVRSRPYYNVYAIEPAPAAEAARKIAGSLRNLGQPGVAFYGDADRTVGTLGLGTGVICNPLMFADMDPDMYVVIDDTIRTWTQAAYAQDTGHPLVVVNHGTSEEFGVRLLNQHLKEAFPDLPVEHLDQGCGYRWIAG